MIAFNKWINKFWSDSLFVFTLICRFSCCFSNHIPFFVLHYPFFLSLFHALANFVHHSHTMQAINANCNALPAKGGGGLGDRESLAAEQVQIKFHSVTPNFPADASQLKLNISLGNGYLISNLYAQYIADDINSLSIQFICNWYLIESKRTIEGSEKCVEINETVINCSSCYKTKIWMLSPSQ